LEKVLKAEPGSKDHKCKKRPVSEGNEIVFVNVVVGNMEFPLVKLK
jgi:hypothetical protein